MASTEPRLEVLSSKWRGCPAADLAGVALFKDRSIGDDGSVVKNLGENIGEGDGKICLARNLLYPSAGCG